MKCLYLLAVLALLGEAAQAQNYRIFRPGLTYQLSENGTPGDTVHVLRLSTGSQLGTDSVFQFTTRTSQSRAVGQGCAYRSMTQRRDNLFGTTLTIRANGEQVLTAANGNTLVLRPRAAVGGTPWLATAGVTAQVDGRILGTVLGQPDSLVAISFSDGRDIVLSKTYGWVNGSALGNYLSPRLPRKGVALRALPEARLGAARTGPRAVYDFQPGDVFLRRTDVFGAQMPCRQQTWARDSIISRRDNPVGDSVIYQIGRRTLTRNCQNAVQLGAPSQVRFVVTPTTSSASASVGDISPLTGYWLGTSSRRLSFPAWRGTAYNGRPVQEHARFGVCNINPANPATDSVMLFDLSSLDLGDYVWTAPGLGETRTYYPNFTTMETNLIGYRKGTETWGQLTTFAQLMLPTRAARLSSRLAAYPVPCQATLSVSFELSQAQPVGAELRDALGRVVLSAPATAYASGPQQLELATAALPAGCYQLHLQLVGDKRTEVLRVLKQ